MSQIYVFYGIWAIGIFSSLVFRIIFNRFNLDGDLYFMNLLTFVLLAGISYFAAKRIACYLTKKGYCFEKPRNIRKNDLFVTGIIFSYVILSVLKVPAYLSGMMSMGLGFILPWIFLGFATLVLFGKYFFDVEWEDLDKKTRKNRKILVLGLLAVVVVGILFRWQFNEPEKMYLKGFRAGLGRGLDVTGLQEWRKTLKYNPETTPPMIEFSTWPETIKKLKPSSISFTRDGDLNVMWGGGFWHWGVCIFPKGKKSQIPSGMTLPVPYGYVWEN